MGGRGGGWRGGGGAVGGDRGGGGARGGGGGVNGGQAHPGGRTHRVGQNNVRETRENVKKFLTFYKRTKSICIDLYCPAFYKRKPYYDELAEFVYDILCPSDELRADLEDVQLHPVKKNLFIKFKTVQSRDSVAERLAGEGLEWPAFHTKVQGWTMDKPIVFVRVLGSSPESSLEDVKGVMSQYGQVLEVRKGRLSRKLPHVTNGTWSVRMIVGEDKIIPSFVFVNDDGEIWQLAHDNQETTCWQCGKQGHIGSRCKEKAVSIEHDLLAVDPAQPGAAPAVPVQTWAHVVRGVAVRQTVGEEFVAERVAEAERLAEAKRLAEVERLAEAERLAREDEEIVAERLADTARDNAAAKKTEDDAAAVRAEKKAVDARVQREATAKKAEDDAAAVRAEEEASAKKDEAAVRVEGEAAAKKTEDEAVTVRAEEEVTANVLGAIEKAEDALFGVDADVEAVDLVAADPGAAENDPVIYQAAKVIATGKAAPHCVTMTNPSDCFLNSAKLSKLSVGVAVAVNCETPLGSSPELPHKVAHVNTSVEDLLSQSKWGSSISPATSSGQFPLSGDSMSFDDPGSSNAMKPGSASMDLE